MNVSKSTAASVAHQTVGRDSLVSITACTCGIVVWAMYKCVGHANRCMKKGWYGEKKKTCTVSECIKGSYPFINTFN